MSINVSIKNDGLDFYFEIDDFKEIINTKKIAFYTIKSNEDGSIHLTFYDKRKKVVKPYVNK